jgi:hypothetical protein
MLDPKKLREALQLIVNNSFTVYHPSAIEELTGIKVAISLTGEDLIDYIYNVWENRDDEVFADVDREIVVAGDSNIYDWKSGTPVVCTEIHTDVDTRIRSRYMEGKPASYLSEHNIPVVEKLKVVDQRGLSLSQDPVIIDLLAKRGFHHRPTLEAYNNTLDYMLASCAINSAAGNWSRTSLNPNKFTGSSMSHRAVAGLINALEVGVDGKQDWEVIRGFKAREGYKQGRETCFRFHDESPIYQRIVFLIKNAEYKVSLDNKYKTLIRSNNKKVVMVDESDVPEHTEFLFQTYKTALSAATISIPMAETQDPSLKLLPEFEYADGNLGYDLGQIAHLHQVYNRKDMGTGGRYYCGFANLKRETRDLTLINGFETTEVDFSSCHPSMLAMLSGKVMPADLYTFGFADRQTNKSLMLIAINCTSSHKMQRALQKEINKLGLRFSPDDWIESVYEAHPWLVAHLGTNAGLRMMNIESEIMANAMTKFMTITNSVALCIHDAMRVQTRHADVAVYCMLSAWREYWKGAEEATVSCNGVVTALGVKYNGWDLPL